MEMLFKFSIFSGVVFALSLLISVCIWPIFFAEVSRSDKALYNKIRFRWELKVRNSYYNFIFNKEFEKVPYQKIRMYGSILYKVGYIGQWAFNIYILLAVASIVYRLAIQ